MTNSAHDPMTAIWGGGDPPVNTTYDALRPDTDTDYPGYGVPKPPAVPGGTYSGDLKQWLNKQSDWAVGAGFMLLVAAFVWIGRD